MFMKEEMFDLDGAGEGTSVRPMCPEKRNAGRFL